MKATLLPTALAVTLTLLLLSTPTYGVEFHSVHAWRSSDDASRVNFDQIAYSPSTNDVILTGPYGRPHSGVLGASFGTWSPEHGVHDFSDFLVVSEDYHSCNYMTAGFLPDDETEVPSNTDSKSTSSSKSGSSSTKTPNRVFRFALFTCKSDEAPGYDAIIVASINDENQVGRAVAITPSASGFAPTALPVAFLNEVIVIVANISGTNQIIVLGYDLTFRYQLTASLSSLVILDVVANPSQDSFTLIGTTDPGKNLYVNTMVNDAPKSLPNGLVYTFDRVSYSSASLSENGLLICLIMGSDRLMSLLLDTDTMYSKSTSITNFEGIGTPNCLAGEDLFIVSQTQSFENWVFDINGEQTSSFQSATVNETYSFNDGKAIVTTDGDFLLVPGTVASSPSASSPALAVLDLSSETSTLSPAKTSFTTIPNLKPLITSTIDWTNSTTAEGYSVGGAQFFTFNLQSELRDVTQGNGTMQLTFPLLAYILYTLLAQWSAILQNL